MTKTKQEELREGLARLGLPHNEVEGNMIIDIINQQIQSVLDELESEVDWAAKMYKDGKEMYGAVDVTIQKIRSRYE